jgi:hypothetical protein
MGRAAPDGSHVHHVPVDRIGVQLFPCSLATGTPQAFPMASSPASMTGFGVAFHVTTEGVYCCPAHIHQVGAGITLEGGQPLVHFRYASRSRLPDPNRLVVPARPVVVRAACRPPLRFQGQAALSFTRLLRQPRGAGLSPAPVHMAPRGAP